MTYEEHHAPFSFCLLHNLYTQKIVVKYCIKYATI